MYITELLCKRETQSASTRKDPASMVAHNDVDDDANLSRLNSRVRLPAVFSRNNRKSKNNLPVCTKKKYSSATHSGLLPSW
jgi:hypothetical protein